MKTLNKAFFITLLSLGCLNLKQAHAAVGDEWTVSLVPLSEIERSTVSSIEMLSGQSYNYALRLLLPKASLAPTPPSSLVFEGKDNTGAVQRLALPFVPGETSETHWSLLVTPPEVPVGSRFSGKIIALFPIPPSHIVSGNSRPIDREAISRNREQITDNQTDSPSSAGANTLGYGAFVDFTNAIVLVGNASDGALGQSSDPDFRRATQNQAQAGEVRACGVLESQSHKAPIIWIFALSLILLVFRQIQNRKKLKV